MEQLKLKDFLKYKYLSQVKYSPNGKTFSFIVKEADEKTNSYKSFIYIYKDNEFKKLTTVGKEGTFYYLNDDEIIFPAIREDSDKERAKAKEQFTPIFKININGGEADKAFEIPLGVGDLKFLPDGRMVFTSEIDKRYPDFYKMSKEDKDKIIKEESQLEDYEIFDDSPAYFNGAGFIYNKRNALFICDKDGKNLKRITDKFFSVDSYLIKDDLIIYTGQQVKYRAIQKNGLFTYNYKTNEKDTIIKTKDYCFYGIFSLKDKLLALATKNGNFGLNEDPVFYEVDLSKKEVSFISKIEGSFGNSTGSDCRLGGGYSYKEVGSKLYFTSTERNACVLKVLNEKGKIDDVIKMEGSIDLFDMYNDDIIMVRIDATSLQEIYKYNLKEKKLVKLSNFNEEVLKDKYVAEPHKVNFMSQNYDIDGWYLLPKDFNPKKKYPAVLDIHGGPKTVYGEIFYHEMQVWANLGYVVFFSNPVGSDGRGDEFADIRGKYGTIDYDNLMDFTDYILNLIPQIDENKVCVTGGSYGGFMTNWIVGHTNRFVVAATQRSISNWTSFSGTSDIGPYFADDQQGCNLFKDTEKMWWHSPVKYAKKVKTPLLFIHSDEDYRCPLEQGLQFYTQIKENGVESKFCLFHGENHELSRSGKPKHRVKRLEEITNWFEDHTK